MSQYLIYFALIFIVDGKEYYHNTYVNEAQCEAAGKNLQKAFSVIEHYQCIEQRNGR